MDVFGAIGSFFQTFFLSFWAAFLLPAGMLLCIVYGGWLYLAPFIAANILLSYKFNKARKSGRLEAYDDKHFGNQQKAINDYLALVEKSKERKASD